HITPVGAVAHQLIRRLLELLHQLLDTDYRAILRVDFVVNLLKGGAAFAVGGRSHAEFLYVACRAQLARASCPGLEQLSIVDYEGKRGKDAACCLVLSLAVSRSQSLKRARNSKRERETTSK